MISVEEARQRILAEMPLMPTESISLAEGLGRILAEDVRARVTQPPAAVSAMDGYAVRSADVVRVPAELEIIGEVPAGAGYEGRVGENEAVRIFTGAPLPEGTDAIVIQEDTERENNRVRVLESAPTGNYVRAAGLDFTTGDIGIAAGRQLTARDIGLSAAMNVPWLTVRRRPRIALLATGDEIVRPGEPIGPNQIVSSNALALAALVRASGGEAIDLGIACDNEDSLRRMAAGCRGSDMLVTLGGASVGEHDLVQKVLGEEGLEIDFWRIAMRPGKPLMFGSIAGIPMLGLPGNPVSSLVCGMIYLRPAIRRMLGFEGDGSLPTARASVGATIGENDRREDYLRARLEVSSNGSLVATPFGKQDSSMLSALAGAGCLIVRKPHAPAVASGEFVDIIRLDDTLPGI